MYKHLDSYTVESKTSAIMTTKQLIIYQSDMVSIRNYEEKRKKKKKKTNKTYLHFNTNDVVIRIRNHSENSKCIRRSIFNIIYLEYVFSFVSHNYSLKSV